MSPDDPAPEALCTFGIPLSPKATDHPDAPLITLEQERADLQAQANAADGDEEANAIQDQVTRLEHEIADAPAAGPVGIAIKLRRLERTFKDSGGAPWDQANFSTALEALDRTGDVNLLLWEQEHDRLYSGTYEEGEEIDRASEQWNALVDKIVVTTAHTPVGVAVKLRLMRSYMKHSDCDWFDRCWDSCLASLVSMTGADAADYDEPDAALQDLWQEYRQNSKEWDAAAADGESDKYGNRAQEIERRIINTPAESALGIAIKLRIAADNFPGNENPEHNDDRALASVLNDADRLAGFTEPQRVWRAP